METALSKAVHPSIFQQIEDGLREWSQQSVDRCLTMSTKFLAAHNQCCILRDPSPDEARDMDRILEFLLAGARQMQKAMIDFPDRDRARRVAAIAWNLNEALGANAQPDDRPRGRRYPQASPPRMNPELEAIFHTLEAVRENPEDHSLVALYESRLDDLAGPLPKMSRTQLGQAVRALRRVVKGAAHHFDNSPQSLIG